MNNLSSYGRPLAYEKNNQTPQFNPEQFQRLAPQMSNAMLNQVIMQARAQGIPENKIQEGLNYINSLRS